MASPTTPTTSSSLQEEARRKKSFTSRDSQRPVLTTNDGETGGVKVVYTAGRPPWYNELGENKTAFVIGVAGGSASGKSTVALQITKAIGVPWVSLLCQDSYYKILNEKELELAHNNNYDFDHPDSIDMDLFVSTVQKLKEGKHVEVPVYNFSTHSRDPKTITMYGANVLIVEGIFTLYDPRLRELMDLMVFVDEDEDIRLARRLKRDIAERGRELQGAIRQYERFVKPSFDKFIKPTMQYADIVVPRGASNNVAMDLIIRHIRQQLHDRGFNVRSALVTSQIGEKLPTTVHVLPPSVHLKVLHTIIRDRSRDRDDFVFHAEVVMRLLVEEALTLLDYEPVQVQTEEGETVQGVSRRGMLFGVSIVRAGLTMENALRAVVKDVPLGKILIQTNPETSEPELYYSRLPKHIHEGSVIVMDPTIATGAAAMMAIRVLVDHGVAEDRIIFISVIAAPLGLQSVAYAFPRVHLVVSAVDRELSHKYHLLPGIGNFGNRYFGTE